MLLYLAAAFPFVWLEVFSESKERDATHEPLWGLYRLDEEMRM